MVNHSLENNNCHLVQLGILQSIHVHAKEHLITSSLLQQSHNDDVIMHSEIHIMKTVESYSYNK